MQASRLQCHAKRRKDFQFDNKPLKVQECLNVQIVYIPRAEHSDVGWAPEAISAITQFIQANT